MCVWDVHMSVGVHRIQKSSGFRDGYMKAQVGARSPTRVLCKGSTFS